MKRSHLRWLVPLIIVTTLLAYVLLKYEHIMKRDLAKYEASRIALEMQGDLYDIDLDISGAMTRIVSLGDALSARSLSADREKISASLKDLKDSTCVNEVFVCNSDGVGFDSGSTAISLKAESYFSEMSREYGLGGDGQLLICNEDGSVKGVALVTGVKFADGKMGYLVATTDIVPIKKAIGEDSSLGYYAMIELGGRVLSSDLPTDRTGVYTDDVWSYIPGEVSKDSIKQAIMQKNVYMSEIKDYGYIIMVPFRFLKGGAMSVIPEKDMNLLTDGVIQRIVTARKVILGAMVFLAFLILLSGFISDRIELRLQKNDTGYYDEETGLLNLTGALREIDKCVEVDRMKGIMFLISIGGIDDARYKKGDKFVQDGINDFVKDLRASFRASDIVGRTGEDSMIVFMKDIAEEKDIRKQTDEFQLFLHDFKESSSESGLVASAGIAIFPNSGKTSGELYAAAYEALERSKANGDGRLSF
ncbi:MAG: diguanylate cyclase [Butyrivibrio sp.]|nr:diguanylate cyclase [Butyrivibrio sp.]